MKLAIGSANFGKKYSLHNHKFLQKDLEYLDTILKKYKINFIDTADNYKNYKKISLFSKNENIKIISKIIFDKSSQRNLDLVVKKKVKYILKNIKAKSIYGILFHDYKDILSPNGNKIIDILLKFKKKK